MAPFGGQVHAGDKIGAGQLVERLASSLEENLQPGLTTSVLTRAECRVRAGSITSRVRLSASGETAAKALWTRSNLTK